MADAKEEKKKVAPKPLLASSSQSTSLFDPQRQSFVAISSASASASDGSIAILMAAAKFTPKIQAPYDEATLEQLLECEPSMLQAVGIDKRKLIQRLLLSTIYSSQKKKVIYVSCYQI